MLLELLGDETFLVFRVERETVSSIIQEAWPDVRIAFEYYLHQNWEMFDKIAQSDFGLESVGQTGSPRSGV